MRVSVDENELDEIYDFSLYTLILTTQFNIKIRDKYLKRTSNNFGFPNKPQRVGCHPQNDNANEPGHEKVGTPEGGAELLKSLPLRGPLKLNWPGTRPHSLSLLT